VRKTRGGSEIDAGATVLSFPYLDGIEFYNLLPFSPELGSAILSGRVDYARALDPATARKAATIPGLSTAKFYQSVIHATWLNAKRQPFDDPRVRRAVRGNMIRRMICYEQPRRRSTYSSRRRNPSH
jgi:ABC-type transport system substrate-binding protein